MLATTRFTKLYLGGMQDLPRALQTRDYRRCPSILCTGQKIANMPKTNTGAVTNQGTVT